MQNKGLKYLKPISRRPKMSFESKSITLSCGAISYRENITRGASVLFIHGNNSAKEAFERQFQDRELDQKYHLLSLDLPGHGASDKFVGNYSLEIFTSCVAEFCKELALERPALVGHSLGGHIAIRASQRVDLSTLAVINTPPLGTPEDLYKGYRPNESLQSLFQAELSSIEKKGVAEASAESTFLQDKVEEWIDVCDPHFRASFPASFATDPCGEIGIIQKLDIPFAYFGASTDTLLNQAYVEKAVGEENIFEIESNSHYFHFEQSEAFNRQLQIFLERRVSD